MHNRRPATHEVFVKPGNTGLFSRAFFFGAGQMIRRIEQAGKAGILSLVLLAGIPGLLIYYSCVTLLDPLLVFTSSGYERPSIIYGYDKTGKSVPIAEFYQFSRRVIRLSGEEEINARVVRCFLATEDNNFYSHPGIDVQGILRAAMVNLVSGQIKEGASTITQQVVRLRFLSADRTMFRKIREAVLSILLEIRYKKAAILEMYLNEVPLGHGTLGVEAAADFYFGKSHTALSWGESALLASLTTRPRDYSPLTNPNRSRDKVRVVLRKLVEAGAITPDEAEKEYMDLEEKFYSTLNRSPNDTAFNRRLNLFPYVTEYVKTQLPKELQQRLLNGGLRIQTTIVVEHQQAAEAALTPALERLTAQRRRKPFKNYFAFDEEYGQVLPLIREIFPIPEFRVQKERAQAEFEREFVPALRLEMSLLNLTAGEDNVGAMVERNMIDSANEEEQGVEGSLISLRPDTGAVTAVVGGSGFTSQNQLLRFMVSRRQPGSAFKPIVYAAGIEYTGLNPDSDRPLTAATVLDDSPVQFVSADMTEYSPENYSATYEGPIRLRKALTLSKNAVAIRVYERLGWKRINPIAEKILGFDRIGRSLPPEAAVALGSIEMTPIDMARSYAVFANGGYLIQPYVIEVVRTSSGEEVWRPELPQKARVLSEGTSHIITSMMQDVVREGTGTGAALSGRDVAGKTGTTNRSTDAWFIGFTPQLVTAVQMGYDSNRTLGGGGTGGGIAAPVFGTFMYRALAGDPGKRFEFKGSNARAIEVCESTGMLPGSSCDKRVVELFLPGTEPRSEGKAPVSSDEPDIKSTREDIFKDGDF